MSKKLTFEFVKSKFDERGYILLESEYINNATPMKYKCLHHPEKDLWITYAALNNGRGCRLCGVEKRSIKSRLSYDFVYNEFKLRNYELLETQYVNNYTKMKYRCLIHPDKDLWITYKDLKDGCGCPYCVNLAKPTFEFIKEQFIRRNYELLETKYINNHTPMKYKCNLHPNEELYITWGSLQQGGGCKFCYYDRSKLTFQFVYDEFQKRGYKLLEMEYVNQRTKMRYQCPNHSNDELLITYNSFQQGHGCPLCNESRGEKRISDFLNENNIKYISQYKFDDCRNTRQLPFDFAIFNKINQILYLLEYDGIGHFEIINFGGMSDENAKDTFNKTQINDTIKTAYCMNNNIKLIRISYLDFDNIEDILKNELNMDK